MDQQGVDQYSTCLPDSHQRYSWAILPPMLLLSLFFNVSISIEGFLKQGRQHQKVFARSLVILMMTQGSIANGSEDVHS